MSEETKKCPYCMEEVNAEAKKCKFCGEILDPVLRELEAMKKNNASGNNGPIIINNNNNNNNNNAAPVAAAVAAAPKSRVTYILLGLFLGVLGIHNFYAGRSGAGVVQLLLTLSLSWLVFPFYIIGLWVLIELFVVKTDGKGVPFV